MNDELAPTEIGVIPPTLIDVAPPEMPAPPAALAEPVVVVPPPPPPGAARPQGPPPPPQPSPALVGAPRRMPPSQSPATGRLSGRTRMLVLAAAVLIIGGAVIAITRGGSSDANARFLARANGICRSERPTINASSDPTHVAQFAEQLLVDLQALGSPPRNAALWQQWLAGEQQAIALLSDGQIQAANADVQALGQLARQLGVGSCA